MTTKNLNLAGKINHDIFDKPQWLPPNLKIDIKLQLAPSNFILQKVLGTAPDAKVLLNLAILHVRKQHFESSVALGTEKIKDSGNNI